MTVRIAEFQFNDEATGDTAVIRLAADIPLDPEQAITLDAAQTMTASRAKATSEGIAMALDMLPPGKALWYVAEGWSDAWRTLGLPDSTSGGQMVAAVRAVERHLRELAARRRVPGRTRGRSTPGAAERQSEITTVLCRMASSATPESAMHAAVRGLVAEKWPKMSDKERTRKENTIRKRVLRWLASARD